MTVYPSILTVIELEIDFLACVTSISLLTLAKESSVGDFNSSIP
jgi:hypothetical protein